MKNSKSNTELRVCEVVDEERDDKGQVVKRFVKWRVVDEVNLGSIKNPNKEVVKVEYRNKINLFGGLFNN